MLTSLSSSLLLATTGGTHEAHDPVYSVTALQARLAGDPQAWVGRTVQVRGLARACLAARGAAPLQACSQWPAYLVDAGAAGALRLAWGRQDSLWTVLRRLPLVSTLLAPPAMPRWGALATYRVHLRTIGCGTTTCAVADVVDVAP